MLLRLKARIGASMLAVLALSAVFAAVAVQRRIEDFSGEVPGLPVSLSPGCGLTTHLPCSKRSTTIWDS